MSSLATPCPACVIENKQSAFCQLTRKELADGKAPFGHVNDQGNCSDCGHKHSVHLSSAALTAPSSVSLPLLLSIQVWNVESSRPEEVRSVILAQRTWQELEEQVRAAFQDHWTAENEGRFSLYFIHDLSDPWLYRTKVDSQEQLDVYLNFRSESRRTSYLQLFLHVAIIFKACGKPISPTKPPQSLSIDTHLARQTASVSTTSGSSSSHLSPPACDSPLSPGSPREKEQRLLVLARDSTPFTPLTPQAASKPLAVYRCVFCGELHIPKLVEAAHLIPSVTHERLNKEVDEIFIIKFDGVHGVRNGVTACKMCHTLFDDGNLWAEVQDKPVDASSSSLSSSPPPLQFHLHIDDTVRADKHASRLQGRVLTLPTDVDLQSAFPPLIWWQWRKEWAELKRADTLSRDMEKLQVSGTCACGKSWNNKCKSRAPSTNTPLCAQCCLQIQESGHSTCRVHPVAPKKQ